MIEFIFLVIFRALSGAQNGAGYAKNAVALKLTTSLLFLVGAGYTASLNVFYTLNTTTVIAFICWGITCLGGVGTYYSFKEKRPQHIHLFESLIVPPMMLVAYLSGGDIINIILSVYPGLVLHKGFVNIGSGLSFFDVRTDDVTGKTYDIPVLGIKIPRWSYKIRPHLAVGSTVLFIIYNFV